MNIIKTNKINRRNFLKSSMGALGLIYLGSKSTGIRAQDMGLDIIIKGGTIVNGSGEVSYKADMGIKDNIIALTGNLSDYSAGKIIDATGLVVCPGFIDIHTHYDGIVRPDLPDTETEYRDGKLKEELNKMLLLQGITTVIGGNCGYSSLNLEKHFALIKKNGISFNYGTLTGHASMRKELFGDSKITILNNEEKDALKRMLERAFNLGSFGMSTELELSPASLAPSKELVELSQVIVPYRGLLAIHRRNETGDVVASTQEAVDICERGKVRVQISHFRVLGKPNWNKHEAMFKVLKGAVGKKLPLRCDFYPYDSCQGFLDYIFPDWARKGAPLRENLQDKTIKERIRLQSKELFYLFAPENIIIFSEVIPEIKGKSLLEGSEIAGTSPAELATRLVLEDTGGKGGPVIYRYAMARGNYEDLVKASFAIISSDGGMVYKDDLSITDPRICGTFPRLFGSFVREKKFLAVEEAVRRVTGLPAEQLRLDDRGLLKEGMKADIVIFNPATISDLNVTYENPGGKATGVEYVMVNGKITVENGNYKDVKEGIILKKAIL